MISFQSTFSYFKRDLLCFRNGSIKLVSDNIKYGRNKTPEDLGIKVSKMSISNDIFSMYDSDGTRERISLLFLKNTTQTSGTSRISRWRRGANIVGGADVRHRYYSVKTYAKMKESGPIERD